MSILPKFYPFCFLLALILSACEPTPNETSATDESVRYVCAEDKSFDAMFMGSDSVRVQLMERVVVLPQVVSASGAKYSDGDVTAWFKGQDDAFVEIAGEMAYADCKR